MRKASPSLLCCLSKGPTHPQAQPSSVFTNLHQSCKEGSPGAQHRDGKLVVVYPKPNQISLSQPGHLTLEFPPDKISSRWHSVMLYKCQISRAKLLLSLLIIKDKRLLCSSALASCATQARELIRSHSRLKLSGISSVSTSLKAHF